MGKKIYCKQKLDKLNFYVHTNGKNLYLFSQDFSTSVNAYYKNGIQLNDGIDFSKAGRNPKLLKTMTKLKKYIPYYEKEYNVNILTEHYNKKCLEKNKKKYLYTYLNNIQNKYENVF